jgi:predicted MPP superfamily phosphohydrolase
MSSTLHFLPFFLLLALVVAGLHAFVFVRIAAHFDLSVRARRYWAGFLIVLWLCILAARMTARTATPSLFSTTVAWVGGVGLGMVLLMSCALVVAGCAQWMLHRWILPRRVDAQRRQLLRRAWGVCALTVGTGSSLAAVVHNRRMPQIKSVSVTLERLPARLDGLRCVQISDVHVGLVHTAPDQEWVSALVQQINALGADVIAITGDLVDGSVSQLAPAIAPLAQLRAAQGVFFVTGNHEYYSGVEPWIDYLRRLGIQVLRNEHRTLFADTPWALDIAGVEDYLSHRFIAPGQDLRAALEGRQPDRPVILLAHQPVTVLEAAEYEVDLQLSGHTHGGQIWPFEYVVRIQQPYIAGLHRIPGHRTQIYVNSGTGFWGPPMRLGTTSEITCITLRCPQAQRPHLR